MPTASSCCAARPRSCERPDSRSSNVDAVVIADQPKLAPHADAIRARLADALGVAAGAVSVKGKTNEGMGETGRGEGIAVHAVALLTGP